ncbi:MAG: acyl-CoA synthetase [Acidimicrobiales bacterium]
MYPGAHASTTPDKPAVIMAATGNTQSYASLDARSNQLARLLHERGLRTGDGFAICMENHPTYLEVAWAGQRSGLYYTAASSRLTAGELAYILTDSASQAVVTSMAKVADVEEALAQCPPIATRLLVDGARSGWESYEDAIAGYPASEMRDATEGNDLLYSSGTTGRPKGIKWPLTGAPAGTPNALLLLTQGLYGFGPDTVYLSPAPMYHAAPLRFCVSVHRAGGTAVVMEHFDPEQFLVLVERYRVTHTQMVPTMFVRLLKLPSEVRDRYDVSSLRCVVHAAAPCPVPVKQQMMEWWGPVIHEYYAGTEGNGFVACGPEEWLAHPGTVGRALQGTVHIVGDDGAEVPAGSGEPGTVYFEGGGTFEYHNDAEKTRGAYNDKGWSTLGDVGYLDADGFLFLTDRKAFMIISGGVNIYPQEAENALVTHPKVLDVAVFGVPNPDFGEEAKAVVQLIDPADAGPDLERELIAYCRAQLADVKCPRSIDFRAELPRHPTGKLYKRVIKDEYWAAKTSRII